ncbi:Hypothetical Protein FCC1311_029622 [Hondaea fermentalgiana]|uniref:Uncharacterized protein n=1 Tax=Hondaea fermentalgiana TaxID=2315210 RepID=A0A2R5GES5_9STRA|nr:Hypothetical Protein FCC1311_029622 [Hondaea fermentalgiana]|eukprot:GBG26741.1 Hypothetical Protein FCC1311_029622 [Hondaea fermentalgiana]
MILWRFSDKMSPISFVDYYAGFAPVASSTTTGKDPNEHLRKGRDEQDDYIFSVVPGVMGPGSRCTGCQRIVDEAPTETTVDVLSSRGTDTIESLRHRREHEPGSDYLIVIQEHNLDDRDDVCKDCAEKIRLSDSERRLLGIVNMELPVASLTDTGLLVRKSFRKAINERKLDRQSSSDWTNQVNQVTMESVQVPANSHAKAPNVLEDEPLPSRDGPCVSSNVEANSQPHLLHAVLHDHGSSRDTFQEEGGGVDLSPPVAEVEESEELCAPLSELEENVWSLRAAIENAYKIASHKSGSDANITFVFKDDSIAQLTLGNMGCDSFMTKTRGFTIDDWGYYTTLARIKWTDKERANPSDVNGKQHAFVVALEELRQDLKAHGFGPDPALLEPPERPGDAPPKNGKKKARKWRGREKTAKSIKMVEKSLYLEGFSRKNGAFDNAMFESKDQSWTMYRSHAQSVLAKNNRIAAHQVHDLKVLCKLVEKITGSPGAPLTDFWAKDESNGIRLRLLRDLQNSYLKKVAGLDGNLLDEAYCAIEHVGAFADSTMRAVENGVSKFDQKLVQRGLLALRALHEVASSWAANASVCVPEVGDLVFKGRHSRSGKEVLEGCNFCIVIKRFNNSPRVLVELRHVNAKDGSFGHHCSITANAEEQRGLMDMGDPVQVKTITDKLMQMRRAQRSAGHGQEASSTQGNTQAERAPKRKRDRLDPRYVATLKEALDQSLAMKDALQFFRKKWGQTEADWSAMPSDKPALFPNDKQLKNKLANMKQVLKKQRSGD